MRRSDSGTLQRARTKLGVNTTREGFGGGCRWVLPAHTSQVSKAGNNEMYKENENYENDVSRKLDTAFRSAIEAEGRNVEDWLSKAMAYVADWPEDDKMELVTEPGMAATILGAIR